MNFTATTSTATPTSAIGRIWVPIAGVYALLSAFCILQGLLFVPLLIWVLPIGVILLKTKRCYVPLLFIAVKMVLDSLPGFSYQEIAAGISIVDAVSLLALGGFGGYLLLKRQLAADAVTMGTVAILGTNLATVVYHGNYLAAFDVISKWFFFLVVYSFMITNLPDSHKLRILLGVAMLSIYPMANQLFSVLSGVGNIHMGSMRYSGTYIHPKIVGEYLLFSIPSILFLLRDRSQPFGRGLLLVLLAMLHSGLFFTGYRTLWIALCLLWLCYMACVSKNKARMALAAATLGGLLCFLPPVTTVMIQKFESLQHLFKGEVNLFGATHFFDDLMSGRVGIWRLSLRAFSQAPVPEILLGLGIGFTAEHTSFYMHNEYLSAVVETGVLGLMALLVWLAILVWKCVGRSDDGHGWHRLLLITLLPMMTLAMGTMPFRSVNLMGYLAIYAAFVPRGHRT